MENDDKELWDKAVFGRQVEEFICSDIGKYLMARAEKDWSEAVLRLRDCPPEQLLKYQADMKRAESIRFWLSSAVEEGLRALNLIQEKEDEND
jgi:hypothetical protein